MILVMRWAGRTVASNFHLKLTSVLLGCLLWVAINGEPQSVVDYKVPLELRKYPKGVEVTGETVSTLDVRVKATSGMVRRLDPSDISAFIDLGDWSLGEHIYSLSSQNVTVPYGVKIVRITPNQIKLNFQRIRNKMVEVQPSLSGDLPRDYRIESVVCHPSTVQISGPENRLKTISHLSTESIDISGHTRSYQAAVHLSQDDPLVQLTQDPEIIVDVTIVTRPARGK